jgi:hypothetical protein
LEEHTASIIREDVNKVMKVARCTEEEGKKWLRDAWSVISGFHHGVKDILALLGCYAV